MALFLLIFFNRLQMMDKEQIIAYYYYKTLLQLQYFFEVKLICIYTELQQNI